MDSAFLLFNKEFWSGESNLKMFLDCPYQLSGGFVLYCTEGEAVISVGAQKHIIKKNAEMVILPGTTFCLLQSTENFVNRIFTFSKELYEEVALRLGISFSRFLLEFPYYIHEDRSEYLKNIKVWMDMADLHYNQNNDLYQKSMLRNFIQSYLMYLYGTIQDHFGLLPKKYSRKQELYHQFLSLLDTHCREQRDVSFYAKQLCITTRYLWMITDELASHESPKEIIYKRFILEIKILLQSTDLSIQEIAQDIKFPDQSYLGRYFKRHTGISPSEYRNKMKIRHISVV